MKNRKLMPLLFIGVLLVVIGSLFAVQALTKSNKPTGPSPTSTPITELPQVEVIKEQYDVIVVGTDPEGVTAAVSAARNGLKTLLIDGKERKVLGGLFTIGWLNSLDMNRSLNGKDYYNKGLFKEWFDQIEGDSFDITTATNAFHKMVEGEPNLEVRMGLKSIEPILEKKADSTVVTGVKLTNAEGKEQQIVAKGVIDATQDADFAAAAGAEFTFGRQDIGDDKQLMAVTPVYKLTGVTPEVWEGIKKTLNSDDNDGTGANEESAWGYTEMWNYPSTNPERIRSRGLNIGRQNDNSMLINAVQIFGVDPFNKASIDEAYEIARKEIPLMVAHMKKLYPELKDIELGDLASELYIRETRHLVGQYRLSMIDLLEQSSHWDDIAFGSYPVDIQSTSPNDTGAVLMAPKFYGVPFRTLVPQTIDGLLVVGRSASFDTLPHGSARVVPLGMATGQAAGAAIKLAMDEGITTRELAASEKLIKQLQERLTEQGMDLKAPETKPYAFIKHPAYEGLKAAASMGIAQGAYKNDFSLDADSNPQRMFQNMKGVAKVHPTAFPSAIEAAVAEMDDATKTGALTLEQAAYTIALAMTDGAAREGALDKLVSEGVVTEATLALIKDRNKLTNGDVYMLFKDAVVATTGVTY
ncbi:FAD-dependent oxidoreductase [Paenibacillus sp. GSMTC-2017]|uniref:FAD-dependent oxidoreductase n=1 Tax=Paenibacillus sp. GSMTC-2017 TaxID=2794350 RepID=UPI0018D9487B|nr:FAD-dependent oxidoreductase [Paenibacillus sp. GSMTC-2017]MBH5317556.1 FAD-dependent oxidoreductase [Paenibacillus sp. GSMTC-2017]